MTKYSWLNDYCLSLTGARKDYQTDWEATRYLIDNKMFLMVGENKEKKLIITLKLAPEFGYMMRQEYSDIIPGYYMNKEHWNSIYIDGAVPDDLLRDMVTKSHGLIFSSLTKKRQKELLDA